MGRISSIIKLREKLKVGGFDFFITAGNDNNCSAIVSKLGLRVKTKVVISEHNALTQVVANSKRPFIKGLRFLVRFLYKYSDALVSVSAGIKGELHNDIGVRHKNSVVIYNPVVDDWLERLKLEDPGHKWLDGTKKVFLGVGRLSVQKNFEALIKAFSLISDDESYRLIILGDGEDKEALQNLAKELKVFDKIDFCGRVDNPYAFMSQSDVFVLSSKFEGLPTVLIEALACNLPIVSTDCPHGASEILEGGKWGRLVPVDDVKALASAMEKAINDPRSNVIERARSFGSAQAIQKYEALLNKLGGEKV